MQTAVIHRICGLSALVFCAVTSSFSFLNEEGSLGLARISNAQFPEELSLGIGLYNRLVNFSGGPDAFNSLIVGQTAQNGGRTQSTTLYASDHTFGVSLAGGRFYQASMALPVYKQDLVVSNRSFDKIFIGDLRLNLHLAHAFGTGGKPWALSIQLGGSLPTSQMGEGPLPRRLEEVPANAAVYGEGSRAGGTHRGDLRSGLAMTYDLTLCEKPKPFSVTANVYTRTTSFIEPKDDDFYDVLGWGALLEWKPISSFSLFGEYLHEGRVEEVWPANSELNDIGGGLAYRFENGLGVVAGAAWGLYNDGDVPARFVGADGKDPVHYKLIGTPDAQVYLALSWEGPLGKLDPDKDGIAGSLDRCPNQPEDADGFEDADGCPDLDNDKDGISDLADACPGQSEDVDGFQDQDGCPELDNDGDNIPDAKDQCPNAAEDRDGIEDQDGCPDIDNDHDGVADSVDQCPLEPQGAKGLKGCPMRDADGDNIPDDLDQCPDEGETLNGYQDTDGCPDKAPVEEKTLILKGVNFETGKAKLTPESLPVLDDIAAQLQAAPNIALEVSGHTDNRGNAAKNTALSESRAQAVADYLLSKGISKDRLSVKGFGSTRPVATNKTAEGRMQNRRVEFNRLR